MRDDAQAIAHAHAATLHDAQVVDERTRIVGMVTRKELLHERLSERLLSSAAASRAATPDTPAAQRGERGALLS